VGRPQALVLASRSDLRVITYGLHRSTQDPALRFLYERGVVRAQCSISEEQCDRVSEVNVKGILFTAQKALPLMRAGGSIILTGSTTGPWERPSSACTARQRPLSGSLLGAGRRT
jgi:NAD(P)-dependent dehydrogenase (short-subunit alcohol dehydrogenase family)